MATGKTDNHSQPEWREKYLDALDAQDELERELTEQRALLSNAVERLSTAAQGQDEELDQVLMGLHLTLRDKSAQQIKPVLEELGEALTEFDQRRVQTQAAISRALTTMLTLLSKRHLSRTLQKEIEHYLAQLPQRVTKLRLYPALIQQLADIQQQVLTQGSSPTTGFWQKLLKGRMGSGEPVRSEVTDGDNEGVLSLTDVSENLALADALHSPETETGRLSSDSLLQKTSTLLRVGLEHLDLPGDMVREAEKLQQHLQQPLAIDQMIGVLESAQALVIEACIFSRRAFADYLDNVNQELASIYEAMSGAMHQHVEHFESAQQLERSMLQQMTALEAEAAQATDLDQLKFSVTSQIGNIRQALHHLHHKDQHQQQLAAQMKELASKLQEMEAEAEKTRSALARQRYKSLRDPLTELPNREAYQERVRAEFNRWQRYQHPLSLAICDLDHFKKINDSFGHQAGDRVLKVIGRSISKRLRTVDFFGRYGGEEFVAILPETNLQDAYDLLEKIRAAIANTAFNYKEQPLDITLSIGVAEFRAGDTIDAVFARADKALYSAKAAGRNRVLIAEQ